MKHRFFILPLLLLGIFSTSMRAAESPQPLRVLLVTGGCCHDYATQKEVISQGLQERAHVEVTLVQQGGTATNSKIPLYASPDWSQGFDVVIHDECFSDVTDRAWVDNILKPHKAGLPAVVVHCAMHCYRDGRDDWFQFCGVTSRRHGAAYPHEVLNRDAEHPIMRGWGAGWANPAGELYWIEKVWPTAHALASAKNRELGVEEVCVWTNEYGENKTRVFGTTLGHHNETVRDPKFLDLLARGTLWACGKLNEDYLKVALAEPRFVPVNLALHKPASASSEETSKNNLAGHAFDGKLGTRWCANGPQTNEWLQVDLEKPTKINGIGLTWEGEGSVYRYRVEGSMSGRDWQLLVDQSRNREKEYQHEFVADNVRFVKITFLGADTGAWGSLWEVSVFGDEKVRIDAAQAAAQAEQEKLADVQVPDGFDITLFAAPPAVTYPTFVAAAPDGTLYVSVDKNSSLDRELKRGSVVRLRDIDGDGRADESKLFIADVDSPRGLVWDHDRLYLMHPPHLSAFLDTDADGIADEQQVLVKNIAFGFKDRPADHTSNGVTLGIDGWLYLAIGDFGFVEAEGTDGRKLQLRGGGVVRVRPDGTGLELYSSGTRNILEVALDPLLNGFARDNTNDGGGWDIRLHHFTGLEDHGYPRLYMNFNEEIIQPLADYGGGSGCGALYLDEPGFPQGFSPALYTADWGRSFVYRHQLTPRGATFQPDQTEFLGLNRVTDLDVDAHSTIYAASWKGATYNYAGEEVGYLLRIRPSSYSADPLLDFESASGEQLVSLLQSPSHRRRLEAQRALLRRGVDDSTRHALERLVLDENARLAARVAALFTLKQWFGEKSHGFLEAAAETPALRAFAIRALTDRADELEGVPPKMPCLTREEADPRVKLEVAVALARLGRSDAVEPLVRLLGDVDPVIAHTAVQALIRLQAAGPCLAIVDQADAAPELRTRALRVLQSVHQPQVVEGIRSRLAQESDWQRRQGLLVALCRLHFFEGRWKGNSWGTRPDTRGPYFQPETWPESDKVAEVLQTELDQADADGALFLAAQLARHRIELQDGVTSLLAKAKRDARFIPAVLAQLHRTRQLPEDALSLVSGVATAPASTVELRTQAVSTLLASSREEAFRAAVVGLEHLHRQRAGGEAIASFKDPGTLNQHARTLLAMSSASEPKSLWIDAGLLLLVEERRKNPQRGSRREVAAETLATAWAQPTRRLQLLEAAQLINARGQEDLVRDGLSDANPAVVALAEKLAKEWGISSSAPTGPRLGTLRPEEALAAVLSLQGDPARGESVFVKLSCNKCHTVKPDEPLRGPYLPNVAKTYKRDQLAESVLLPSKTIAQGFATNLFLTTDGKQISGFVIDEAADVVTIRNNEGNELQLRVEDIEERAKQPISMMPENVAHELTLEEFASLLTYLESLAAIATADAKSP